MIRQHYSSRRYPKRRCKNSNCQVEPEFAPHDKRQEYCSVQCRTDAGNDKRREDNLKIFGNEKKLRQCDKKLEKIYNHFVEGEYAVVHKDYFNFEKIDLRLLVTTQTILQSGQQIRWFYKYGTERSAKDENYFIIHKK